MGKIPARFRKTADAFDEVARARFCESSGSEHSPENSTTDLSDLVNSFIERDERDEGNEEEMKEEKERNESESDSFLSDSETKDILRSLFDCDGDDVKRNIRDETELAWKLIGDSSSEGFKRRLMSRLRERGLDAGLCKSRWEKTGRFPSGSYEYIDVNVSGTRYAVEVFLGGEFEIARPTSRYISLLNIFPPIFVGKVEELKEVVRLMCAAVKESMRSMDMSVPPWRRNGYMQAKWFGSYKRTINRVLARKASETEEGFAKQRSIGFEAPKAISYYCRDEFASKVGLKVGLLAAALNGNGVQL
ncbi:hypothetical protein L1049_009935 [Liquidambar formosana]|uniref:DUF506 family protein n=1 Tax=Liquidambar formosana TaxID=63359 RepID=A0AAP0R182_LIQFO